MQRIRIIKAPSKFLWYYNFLGYELNAERTDADKNTADGWIAENQYVRYEGKRIFAEKAFILKKHGKLIYDSTKFIKRKGYKIKWHIAKDSVIDFLKNRERNG